MRIVHTLFLIIGLFVLAGCQSNQDHRMVLLDQPIKEINVSQSAGVGDVNLDIAISFDDKTAIKVFEKAIKTAVKQLENTRKTKPDYDIMVEYVGGFPTHAIHLWLGKEGERSTLMYMVGEGETYVTTVKATKQLREMLHLEK